MANNKFYNMQMNKRFENMQIISETIPELQEDFADLF